MSSSILIPTAKNAEITPAMLAVIWGIAHELDQKRVPANVENAVWLEIPSSRLRNPDGRNDNHWLKKVYDRLMTLKLEGEYRGDEWGAVVLAQWEVKQGGSISRLLIPPAAVQAIRAPDTFARIEMAASWQLKGHARRLYAALADKKRMAQTYWEYPLEELQSEVFNLDGKYSKWYDFNRYVLTPALDQVNDYGTVRVKMTTRKKGKSIDAVRFDWSWKSLDEARVTDEENQRHASARRKSGDGSAPPLTDVQGLPQLAQNVRAEVNEAQWNSWFAPCEFVEDEQGKISVVTPSDFHAKFVREHFQELLDRIGWSDAENRQGTIPVITKAEAVKT